MVSEWTDGGTTGGMRRMYGEGLTQVPGGGGRVGMVVEWSEAGIRTGQGACSCRTGGMDLKD